MKAIVFHATCIEQLQWIEYDKNSNLRMVMLIVAVQYDVIT